MVPLHSFRRWTALLPFVAMDAASAACDFLLRHHRPLQREHGRISHQTPSSLFPAGCGRPALVPWTIAAQPPRHLGIQVDGNRNLRRRAVLTTHRRRPVGVWRWGEYRAYPSPSSVLNCPLCASVNKCDSPVRSVLLLYKSLSFPGISFAQTDDSDPARIAKRRIVLHVQQYLEDRSGCHRAAASCTGFRCVGSRHHLGAGTVGRKTALCQRRRCWAPIWQRLNGRCSHFLVTGTTVT